MGSSIGQNVISYLTFPRGNTFDIDFDSSVTAILRNNSRVQFVNTPERYGQGGGRLNSYQVLNNSFNDIIWISNRETGSYTYWKSSIFQFLGAPNTKFLWAKGVGLIEQEIVGYNAWTDKLDTCKWQLIDYRVNKF